MPLPHPHSKEKEQNFISRCAGDTVMNKEFPKQKNKLGVCYSIWKQYKKKHANASWDDYINSYRKNGINILP